MINGEYPFKLKVESMRGIRACRAMVVSTESSTETKTVRIDSTWRQKEEDDFVEEFEMDVGDILIIVPTQHMQY